MRKISDPDLASELMNWLIGPARKDCTPEQVVAGLAERLMKAGMRLWRIRISQRVSNPLIGAWGVMWTRDGGAEGYTVPRRVLATSSYLGSPFERVMLTRSFFRRSLENLSADGDHAVLFELAETGSTDYVALPLEYGDGSIQVAAFTTDRPGGFEADEVALLECLTSAIAAALEPAAMRYSMRSLLEVYLGNGPAERVVGGAFHRGDVSEVDAAVLIADLRDFTGLSERTSPPELLEGLGSYFEVVVDAAREEGGDILKFIGDGVLAVFQCKGGDICGACLKAVEATKRALANEANSPAPFVVALHFGPVVYGNIGSPDRLDFTVVGSTVNHASRLEGMAKLLGRRAVCSPEVANALPAGATEDLGVHMLKGFEQPQRVFGLNL
ncbi:adenylate/guanylate cyclase domain-containing protein [Pseudaminobacter sp. 19-2017]|uniref:Adenylate/guanylate cyclase domain-containing protein n=1 Tax=Pseudaminobacter soli (ex Zhang et al. 2022) TaxID=2831468 RepID=A0A942E0T4_9HYPH|nr:adenylate/guanylate cyclase domain-containing protein [Pseudaminobacter soli]MBS3650782.1 adenylate/guanylate cyclase domain-containing protein [Pseudaminobacter soli]